MHPFGTISEDKLNISESIDAGASTMQPVPTGTDTTEAFVTTTVQVETTTSAPEEVEGSGEELATGCIFFSTFLNSSILFAHKLPEIFERYLFAVPIACETNPCGVDEACVAPTEECTGESCPTYECVPVEGKKK